MNNRLTFPLVAFLLGATIMFGVWFLWGDVLNRVIKGTPADLAAKVETPKPMLITTPSPSQTDTLDELSSRLMADLQAENRLNLNMTAQLRAYQDMLEQVSVYAHNIEKDIDVYRMISQNAFQEDVTLQAALFGGKKAGLVAKHLEEFKAYRVGAILAKMKEREAGNVLDVWAVSPDPKVSLFYRDVMASYLSNKRYDANPESFKSASQELSPASLNAEHKAITLAAPQSPTPPVRPSAANPAIQAKAKEAKEAKTKNLTKE